jgi:hypothetical protein
MDSIGKPSVVRLTLLYNNVISSEARNLICMGVKKDISLWSI